VFFFSFINRAVIGENAGAALALIPGATVEDIENLRRDRHCFSQSMAAAAVADRRKIFCALIVKGAAMSRLDRIVKAAAFGFTGAVIGWIAGFVYYFLVSVPRAELMNPLYRETYLCSEGQAPLALAILGIILGVTMTLKKRQDGSQILF
jgi:hypothetical protein